MLQIVKNSQSLIYALFIGAICCMSVGCSKKQQMESTHFENENFYLRMEQGAYKSFECDVTSKSTTKGGIDLSDGEKVEKGDDVIVRITPTVDVVEGDAFDLLLLDMKTLKDLSDIVRDYAAELTIVDKPSKGDKTVTMSNDKIKEALAPMVEESKSYLRSKGMSNEDIRLMLEEQEADETALVPFSLALLEAENNAYYAWLNAPKFTLISSAYAAVDWDQVRHCSIQAIGMDFMTQIGKSSAKVWTRQAIKKAFKCVAKKMCGPAGALIALADFAACMGWINL